MEHTQYTTIPDAKFNTLSSHPLLRFGGPDYANPDVIFSPSGTEVIAAKSFSPFPLKKDGHRMNDPVSDRFYASIYDDKYLFIIAQSTGPDACTASELAILGFIDNMARIQNTITTTQDAARRIQRSVAKSHDRIMSKEGINASTEILCGIFGMLDKEVDNKWAFVACGVGHCKAFILSKDTASVVDVTKNNYLYKYDTPQGSIGPVQDNMPKLDNMRLFCHFCNPGDIVILTTQGVFKNFHPQHLGYSPSKVKLSVSKWENIESEEDKKILNDFICKRMRKIGGFSKKSPKEPSEIAQKLSQAIFELTQPARAILGSEGMTEELFLKKPEAKSCFMNHGSAFCIKATPLGAPSEYLNSCKELSFSQDVLEMRKREWEWKAFIDTTQSAPFDILAFLSDLQPSMDNEISSAASVEVEDCYLDLKDSNIELSQKSPLALEIRYRTHSNNFTRLEKWEYAGELDLGNLKSAGKNSLLTSLSNILRSKSFDIRDIKKSVDKLAKFDPTTDIVVVKGAKKSISLKNLGGKFSIHGKDLLVTQTNAEIYCLADNSAKKIVQIIEIYSTKESSLLHFVEELEVKDHWNICSYAEYIDTVLRNHSNGA